METPRRGDPPEPERRARLLLHPLRHRLLFEYAAGTRSPSELAAELGERLNVVSYHTAMLARAGLLDLVRTERHRGAIAHFYRAQRFGEIDDADWERLPLDLRHALVRRTLELTWREATAAVPSGGMDDGTAHVSRDLLELDERGRAELAGLLRSTLEQARRIAAACRARPGQATRPSELIVLGFSREPDAAPPARGSRRPARARGPSARA